MGSQPYFLGPLLVLHLYIYAFCLVGRSVGKNCTDGFDDVYSLALDHWMNQSYEIQTQPMTERSLFDSNCNRCQSCRLPSQYREKIVNGSRLVASNGMPDHVFQIYAQGHSQNPNEACSQPVYMALKAKPTKGAKFYASGLGPVGLAVTGAFLFNHLANPSGYEDVAAVQEDLSFDTCMGHAAPSCIYHYHRAPTTGCIPNWNQCVHVGWMRDGFPVYSYCRKKKTGGPFLKTCYEQKPGTDGGTTSHYVFNKARFDSSDCDLDEANGYNFPSEIWNGTKGIDDYGYVFSEDYPFIMPGYYGTELHPVIGLTGSSLATSGLLVGMCMATVWGWGLFQY